MNNIVLLIVFFGIILKTNAQDKTINGTTFKANGNVGIGTSAPNNLQNWNKVLDVHGKDHSKVLATSVTNNIKVGAFAHGSGWKGIVGRLGTESNHDLRLMAGYGRDQLTIRTNGNIGIGTPSTTQKLEIFNPNAFNTHMEAQIQDHISLTSNYHKKDSFFGGITWKTGTRRRASIVATREHDDNDHVGIAFFTQGTDGPGPMYESMRIKRNGNVGIGTPNPDAKLTVAGNIHSREVKVSIDAGADFVFANDYALPDLGFVENFVKENKHLPGIASEKEMQENGLHLAEMNIKLLQKVEELILYVIQLKKEVNQLKTK